MILPDFVVKYAAEKVGICLAGSIGGATALLAVTTAIAEEKIIDLVDRIHNDAARWSDVLAATAAVEATLYSGGVYVAATELAVVTLPALPVVATIVVAGTVALYYQHPTASEAFFKTLGEGIGRDQPWTFLSDAYKAYKTEILIEKKTYIDFVTAKNWVAPRDPLVLDLDGGGISTSAINPNAPIYFDQNGDGIRTATGWISAGEALVVRDLNGNGLIDSGRELFGDSTLLTRSAVLGQTAANGFTALADLDSDANGIADGQFNSQDTAFNSVRLWQDINQDGISQANELHTFAELGVIGINVNGVANNINLGGGNSQALSGNFIRSDGQIGSSGTVSLVGSLLLVNNNKKVNVNL